MHRLRGLASTGATRVMDKVGKPKKLISTRLFRAMEGKPTRVLRRVAGVRRHPARDRRRAAVSLWQRVPLKVDVIRDRAAIAREVEARDRERLPPADHEYHRAAAHLRDPCRRPGEIHLDGAGLVDVGGANTRMVPIRVRVHVEREHVAPGTHPSPSRSPRSSRRAKRCAKNPCSSYAEAMRALKAGLLYFAAVFSAGVLLGTARVLWVVPAVGTRTAELLELPVMLAIVIAAAVWIVRRFSLPPTLAARLGMGLPAVGLLLAAEFLLVLPARGMTAAQYLASLDTVAAAASYAALVAMAAMPLFVQPSMARRGRLAFASTIAMLAAAAAVVALKYRYDLDAAFARIASGSEVSADALRPIEYASVGQGPAVLLVHGAGGGIDQPSRSPRKSRHAASAW
jgi:hypothetical protein